MGKNTKGEIAQRRKLSIATKGSYAQKGNMGKTYNGRLARRKEMGITTKGSL